ncbi:T9SS type A sorting domain-containing protein [Flavobacterium soli]|uniref:T9SS type A sorting domain-containing protein n=1 Tax=Flavobacterium soli TaxID=344881 RepID=UPI0003F6235D|nr:T9SS type A sorting domain-containing protein [Flavobacterium soli]
MKTKLLFAFLSIIFFSTSYSQQEASSYISGLVEPSAIINQGNMLYVQGLKNLYQINTEADNPSATTIYTSPTDFYMSNLTVDGTMLYISEENYVEALDEFVGCRIISLDLNNLTATPNVIFSTTQYVSSLAIKDDFIYFTSETTPTGEDNFTVEVHKIDITSINPVATVLINSLTTDEVANDMTFYGNDLLISVGADAKIYSYDVTSSATTASDFLTGLSFNKGIFVSGNALFTAEAHFIKTKQLNNTSSLTSVAQNTMYQDSNNGIPFNANFRDVVLIGDTLYMTLKNQGRVVTVQDASLSATEFDYNLKAISIYNSTTELNVTGLENSQTATVYNLSGQLLLTKQVSVDDYSMDISSFSEGVYLVTLDNQKTFKFIK